MPCSRAAASTKGFHDDPGWRPLPPPSTEMASSLQQLAATSTRSLTSSGAWWHLPRARFTWPAVALKSRPPTMARTKPLPGSTDTRAISMGGWVPARASLTVRSAVSWRRGSRVVWISRPPA